ncbi:MAG: Wzt carbohydrate-binding domain-containing protein, partial [Sulfuricellaceae bacterium]|nr:Wzt carbohydrate-binding domain-containing protein [Sulfuricellaceae bacterium]
MTVINQLCPRSLLLDAGQIAFQGLTGDAVALLAQSPTHESGRYLAPGQTGIIDATVDATALLKGDLVISIRYQLDPRIKRPRLGLTITTLQGLVAFGTNTEMEPEINSRLQFPATGTAVVRIPAIPLLTGEYRVNAWLGEGPRDHDSAEGLATFRFSGRRKLPAHFRPDIIGPLDPPHAWSVSNT